MLQGGDYCLSPLFCQPHRYRYNTTIRCCVWFTMTVWGRVEKNHDFFLYKIFYLNRIFFIWNIDIYIDVYIYKLFQTCSIQIDLGTCLDRGYMIHKASPPVVA